jgi:hypothetical protein
MTLILSPFQTADSVFGRVDDEAGPVAGATIRMQGSPNRTKSDGAGRFRLRFRDGRRITASLPDRLIAGAPAAAYVELRLRPLPRSDHDDYDWVDPTPDQGKPGNCGNCHSEIYREWSGSGHARAAVGRRFRDLYEGTDANGRAGVSWGLLTEHPLGGSVCASCHAPTAEGEDLPELRGVAAKGVHCDYCHKIQDVGDGPLGLSHGRFNLRLLRPPPGTQLFFGPLDDVDRGEDSYSPLYRDSRYCASCHEGVVFGVPVYTTYSEWLLSPARRQGLHCQDCHMAPTGKMHNIAPGRGGVERDPATLGNHRFFDGDQESMLRRCLRVSITLDRGPQGVEAVVTLQAEGVGHRVPTGYIDRQLLLIVEPFDAAGRSLAALEGPILPQSAGKALLGRAGKLYAKQLRDDAGRSPAPFWRTDGAEPQDTRLTPGQVEKATWFFPADVSKLRVRIVYRRFWDEVTWAKDWPSSESLVYERFVAP